mmetsp:Transcript_6373/g.14695  ORF Transcript_6373/g.14695 Transcript_6373/m.14695 type:complete len:151 (+) Transcript_6373:50-502(+)
MARLLCCLVGAALLQAATAFVAPQGAVNQPGLRAAGKTAPMPMDAAQETTSSPMAVVAMASMLGLVLGLASAPKPAMAEITATNGGYSNMSVTQEDKDRMLKQKQRLKDEIAKQNETFKKNAKSKEERLKIEMEKLRAEAAKADTTYASS